MTVCRTRIMAGALTISGAAWRSANGDKPSENDCPVAGGRLSFRLRCPTGRRRSAKPDRACW
jgi:hypothetical protein